MDFQTLKRRDLQALCKLNNIPANLTNAAMADALNSLEIVKGIEDCLAQSEAGGSESPEKSVSRTSTRQKPSKEGLECSEVATRTRCGSRRVAIEGTDTRKTTTTARTTRRRATQEVSIQREMEKDMQAKFEEDLEQSDISANSGVESIGTSEEVSEVSVDQCGHILSRSQNEPEHTMPEVNNDGEVVDLGDDKESIEMSDSLKLDFHCLGRKDLQNLCKRNKIPANMTNAAMADALASLDTVEGLEEFLEGYDPLAIKSPETSRMTSSRVRQARTAGKTTGRKSARAGSALCKSLTRKMEDLNEENQGCPLSSNTNEGGMSVEVDKNLQSHLDLVPEISSTINRESKPVSEEAMNEPDTSIDALVNGKEHHDEMVENKCDGTGNEGTVAEISDISEEVEANLSIKSNVDNHSAVVLGQEFSNLLETEVDDASENASSDPEVKVNISEETNLANELVITDTNCSGAPNADKCLMLEVPEADINGLDECIELNDKSADTVTLESESDTNFTDEPHGLMHAPAVAIKGFAQSRELSVSEADDEDSEMLPGTENSNHHLELANEDVSAEEDSDVPEQLSKKFVSETATQASQHAKGKATPLCHKSLRKLKKLVKEKLQETNVLAKKLEKLTLQDNEITIGSSNSDVDVAKKVEEDVGEVLSGDVTADAAAQCALSMLTTNEISLETFNETDGVDQQVATGTQPTESGALEQAGGPICSPVELLTSGKAPKPLVFTTPNKSSCKTPMSAGRTIRVLDANKENIDSATRTTEAGKIKITVTPAKSMGKLKKEVKVLLEKSEKKRPALQSRSDNQCSLTSP